MRRVICMSKIKFIGKRLGMSVITLWLITLVVFFVIQLPPGDFVDYLVSNMIAEGEVVTDFEVESMKEMYGTNRPFLVQYADWMKGILTGDWGVSFFYKEKVTVKIGETLGATLAVSFITMIFTYLLSIPIAIYSAKHQYSVGDYLATFIGFIGMAIPNFLFAIILMFLSYKWFGKPIMGLPDMPPTSWPAIKEWVKHMIIPIIVIGTSGTCGLIRSTRAQMLDEQARPYILSTRARGVSETSLTYKYAMRSVLNPVVSGLGGMISGIFNGSTITAIVLMLPTQGPVLLKALESQDVYLSGGILLISAILVVIGTLISDLLLMAMDPRIKDLEESKNEQ